MPMDATNEGLPSATIRTTPEDFLVEEIAAYPPSGKGEHLFVTFRKRGLTTFEAVRQIAQALGVDPREAGSGGMKDRHAVTTQTASFHFPLARDHQPALATLALPGITIVDATRHDGKLKAGHLIGNRFRVVLRGLDAGGREVVRRRLAEVATRGVPNSFGPQRFGRDGSNPERALGWLAGKWPGPRDRREQRFLFSSLQSLMFNEVLERRERDGSWDTILPGDVAKKHDSGGLFTVPLDGPELADAVARGAAGELSPTGPMFGAKMRWPLGAVGELEREVLVAHLDDPERLNAHHRLGEGTRRSLRMLVSDLAIEDVPEGLAVSFMLTKGGYATTVLGRACTLVDASRQHGPQPTIDPDSPEEEAPEP